MAENKNPLFDGYTGIFDHVLNDMAIPKIYFEEERVRNNRLKFNMEFQSGVAYVNPGDLKPYIDADYEVIEENPMQIPEQKLLEDDKNGDPVRR